MNPTGLPDLSKVKTIQGPKKPQEIQICQKKTIQKSENNSRLFAVERKGKKHSEKHPQKNNH